jgi:hypothetical protein
MRTAGILSGIGTEGDHYFALFCGLILGLQLIEWLPGNSRDSTAAIFYDVSIRPSSFQ